MMSPPTFWSFYLFAQRNLVCVLKLFKAARTVNSNLGNARKLVWYYEEDSINALWSWV